MQFATRVNCLVLGLLSIGCFGCCHYASHPSQIVDDGQEIDHSLRKGEKELVDVTPNGETSRDSLEPNPEEWLFAGTLAVESWDRVASELQLQHIEFFIDSGTMPAIMVQAHDLDLARKIIGNNTLAPK